MYGGLLMIKVKGAASVRQMPQSRRPGKIQFVRRRFRAAFSLASASASAETSVAVIFAFGHFAASAMAMQPVPVPKSKAVGHLGEFECRRP
jgi:hypothetical protein